MLRTVVFAACRPAKTSVSVQKSHQWLRSTSSSTSTGSTTHTRIEQPAEFRRQNRNRGSNDANDDSNKQQHTTPFGWLMLSIPIATFGLGCWQVQRKQWKEGLVAELATQTNKPAVDFPFESIADLDAMEYQNVRVRGQFLHERELTMGPRSLIEKNGNEAKGGLITRQDSSIGFLVITPFQVEGTGQIILVNRGWVPRKFVRTETRAAGNKLGTTELVGVVRKAEGRPQFAPKSSSDQVLYRDIPHISRLTGALPYWLDADAASTVAGGPIGGQTRVTLRNDHLSYLVTWYSLSAVTAYLWYRQIYKRIPR